MGGQVAAAPRRRVGRDRGQCGGGPDIFCINIGGQVYLLTGIYTALLRDSPCARVILCALHTNLWLLVS